MKYPNFFDLSILATKVLDQQITLCNNGKLAWPQNTVLARKSKVSDAVIPKTVSLGQEVPPGATIVVNMTIDA